MNEVIRVTPVATEEKLKDVILRFATDHKLTINNIKKVVDEVIVHMNNNAILEKEDI